MKSLILPLLLWIPFILIAQQPTALITSFSSLQIPVSSRGLSMGDAGIAGAEGNQQLYYNIAKSAFIPNQHQASVSYMPWMKAVSNDISFINASYMTSVSSTSAFGTSVSYLNLGNMAQRDENGATLLYYNQSEYNVMGSYALKIGERAAVGAGFHLLGEKIFTTTHKQKMGLSSDVSYYGYTEFGDASRKLEWGAVISNLGPKVTLENVSTPLPAKAGAGISFSNNDPETDNQYSISLDASRLIKENWKAVHFSLGAECGYAGQFFIRCGVSLENETKGNRKYFSVGAAYKGLVEDQSWGIDIHYLVPFGVHSTVSPFQNSYGFTLYVNFGNFE
ncbi:MAG: porV [Chitinophagaceae bacterium]|nr:porV [Chitinophagaceae bacterium]